jgi:hypothetical protein
MKKIIFLIFMTLVSFSMSRGQCSTGGPNQTCDGYCVEIYDQNGVGGTYQCLDAGGSAVTPNCVKKPAKNLE